MEMTGSPRRANEVNDPSCLQDAVEDRSFQKNETRLGELRRPSSVALATAQLRRPKKGGFDGESCDAIFNQSHASEPEPAPFRPYGITAATRALQPLEKTDG